MQIRHGKLYGIICSTIGGIIGFVASLKAITEMALFGIADTTEGIAYSCAYLTAAIAIICLGMFFVSKASEPTAIVSE